MEMAIEKNYEGTSSFDSEETLSQEVMTIPDQAQMILVKDPASMTRANELFLVIKGLRKKIADTLNPIIQAAHNAHKIALGKKAELEAPLIAGEKWLNGQMTAYYQEQERKRKAEEDRLRQEAIQAEMARRQEEEERKMAKAAILEAAGATDEADQLVNEAIQAKEEPVVVQVAPPPTPKVQMTGATVKEYWSAEVFDRKALAKAVGEGRCPLSFIEPNMTALNAQARSLKNEMSIPGVRATSTGGVAGTGRR